MNFEWLPGAKEDYLSLPKAIRKKTGKSTRLFEANPWHPSLHTEKINLRKNIWSARIDLNYRFTFQWIQGGILIRAMGSHQDIYRKP